MAGIAKGPLAGMRVIELAHIMAGPVCGLMLADMGADVVKVEKPEGDDSRRFLPPDINGESAAFMMMNRNKRGIVLDLKRDEGKEALRRLLLEADVVIENYRKGTMAKLGLGFETIRKDNPGLIYCEISGFGRTGPYADRGGFDLIAQGMSGLMSITGEGQRVDTSLFEAGIVHTYWQSAIAMATGVSPGPMGSAHPLNAPYQAFQTSDGWINVGAANQRNWERLATLLEAPELVADPRFQSNRHRMQNLAALEQHLAPIFRRRSTEEWLAAFAAADVPAGPVLSIDAMHRDPQALARNMVLDMHHPVAGATKAIGFPIKFSATPGETGRPAPMLGEHTREVLSKADYAAKEIDTLFSSGVAHGC